mgnify:FL=1
MAAESISKLLSEKTGDIAGRVTEGNSSLIRAVAETRKNLEEYNKVLENFQKTVDKSDEVIQNAVKTLDQVNASAKSGVQTLSDSGTVLSDTRTAVGIFSTQFSDSMSNGETLLNNTYVSASAKLHIRDEGRTGSDSSRRKPDNSIHSPYQESGIAESVKSAE